MRKNILLHIKISTELKEQLQEESEQTDISLSELCRKKLSGKLCYDELDRLLLKLWDKIRRDKNAMRSL